MPWNSRPRHGRRDRARRRRAGRSVCTPPLSKALWKARRRARSGAARRSSASSSCSAGASSLDLDAHTATDDTGEAHSYERLLLATGGTPRRVDAWDDGVVYYRTLQTYRQLREVAGEGVRATVIGVGFIGSEVAAALAMNDCAVTIVFPDPGVGARIFPAELASFVSDYYRSKGVDVRDGQKVESISRDDGSFVVATENGEVGADVVVAGLGILPQTDLAEQAGLEVDDGVLVDDRGRAGGREDVFAAGDVARFPVAALGGTRRVEHEDHANTHGRHVGANMAGADAPYDHSRSSTGPLRPRLRGGGRRRLAAGHPRGVGRAQPQGRRLLRRGREAARIPALGRVDRVDAARDLIRASKPVTADQLRALVA